jgi:hypothetical protein
VIALWLVPHSQFVVKPAPSSREVNVRQRRSVVCVVAACLLATLEVACAAGRKNVVTADDPCMLEAKERLDDAQKYVNCRRGMHPREALLHGGYVRDGRVRFRIAYDHDVEAVQRRAFQGAMALWNAHSHLTGFVFEDATSAIIDLRLQRGAPGELAKWESDKLEADICTAYAPAGPYIWYSPTGMGWMKYTTSWPTADIDFLLAYDPEFAGMARIYAQEIGHALNIDHKPGKTVMREGHSTKLCRELGIHGLADIQQDDVRDARACGCSVRRRELAKRSQLQ